MTIDERLERLTERHETLAQSVEVMTVMHRENEQRLGQIMDSMNRLINVVEAHEHRLDSHDDRFDHLEGK
jgi:acetolactate synthase small subunit